MGADDGSGPYASQTSANTSAPWVEGGKPLDVDLTGLRDYAKHMVDQQRDLMTRIPHLGHLSQMPAQAYNGDVLGEAAFLRSQLQANAAELNSYLSNLGQTLFNIGSAAQTVADIYGSGDALGAADLSDVQFAFGDKSVPRPDGLPPYLGQTYQEALIANAAKTPPPADSGQWGPATETSSSPYQTTLTSQGPNGMVRETVTTSVPGSGVTVLTTTIYDGKGKVVSTSTTRTTTTYDIATNTQVKTEQTGGQTTTTTTKYGSDGTVVNEQSRNSTTTNGHETPTGRREVSVDPQTGERVETTYVTRDGKEVVTDRLVIGPATKGETSYDTPMAQKYDPMSPQNG